MGKCAGRKMGRYRAEAQMCSSFMENERECQGGTQRLGGQCWEAEVQGLFIEAVPSPS